MANLIRRGLTWYARLHVPEARWSDVGKAMNAKGGMKRELVRTLQTTDRQEAKLRHGPALEAMRGEIDAALKRAKLKPLTDWTANWQGRAVELREGIQASGDVVAFYEPYEDPQTGERGESPVTEASLTRETIEDAADELRRKLGADAARQFTAIATGTSLSVAQAARQFIADAERRVSAGTIVSHKHALKVFEEHLAATGRWATLEAVTLDDITRRIAGEFVESRRAGRAAGTVLRDFSAYSGLWRWARRRGYTETNPWEDQTAGMKAPRADEAGKEPERAYSTAELVKLLRAGSDDLAPNRGGYAATFWDLIRLALLTGARLDELLTLRVGDVIENGEAIAVAATGKGKSASASRIIPLHIYARQVVVSRLASLGEQPADASLWPEVPAPGKGQRKSKTIATRYPAIRRRIIGQSDTVDFHSFRRTFLTATETALHGGGRINEQVIALIAGHKREGLAFSLYSDWARMGRPEMAGSLAEKLGPLKAAVDDTITIGLHEEVLKALEATAGDRPTMKRSAPAFSRKKREE